MRYPAIPEVLEICRLVQTAGGRSFLVGGFVRDSLLGMPSKDFDLEVFGLEAGRLRALLEKIGRIDTVGESFTVYKLALNRDGERHEIDIALPRRESKIGLGHRGFEMTGDPTMTPLEAAARRDFTVNAILYDPLQDEILDPFNGISDLNRRRLRAIDPRTFIEDSLRVLRAMQLAARFQFSLESGTVALCRSIDLSDLPAERIWGEFEKLLLKSRYPSIGLEAALDLGITSQLWPELERMIGCPQEPEWHPEGDVWAHTRLMVDQAAKLAGELPKEKRLTVLLAALCHDLGKPLTTEVIDGRIRSFRHDQAGIEPTIRFLDSMKVQTFNGFGVRDQVIALVLHHLAPAQLYRQREEVGDGSFRRLALKCNLDLLYRVAKADSLGRTAIYREAVAEEWFIARVRELQVEHRAPAPLLLGRHVLEMGLSPGPRIGQITRAVYELQLDGLVTNLVEALQAARDLIVRGV